MSDSADSHPLGATVGATGVSFRVWAPDANEVSVQFDPAGIEAVSLDKDALGYFVGHCAQAKHGATYRYALDRSGPYPDPYSRYQPQGPHGPSMVIDPALFLWHDSSWAGLDPARQVVYELHVGTFTPQGSYQAAALQFERLRDLGITTIELLPLNEFVGEFGWGYDGVNLFAPFHAYGTPDELRALVDHAHGCGLGVVLDVVYNHFGSHGNFLPRFAPQYLDHDAPNPWGGAPNFACAAMRQLVIDNAAYWVREFHLDGLRLDATQNIQDPKFPDLLASLVSAARAAAGARCIVISAEDFLQRAALLGAVAQNGAQLDLLWNDDFHHAARVAVTGNHAGYFQDYRGRAQELLSALRHGYLFQGQYNGWDLKARGTPVKDEPLCAFVVFTQNHDQIANTLFGQRLHQLTSPGKYRALTAALILGPCTPLLFMGQEFNASSPFAYFADYQGATAAQLWASRRRELAGFAQYADPAAQAEVLNPCSRDTVIRSTLDSSECEKNAPTVQLFGDLLRIRREDPVLNARPLGRLDGATLTENAFVLRWFSQEKGDRLLLVNLGTQIDRRGVAEPLLAPPAGKTWRMVWSSNDPCYDGHGTISPLTPQGWQLDAECSIFCVAD